MVLQRVAFDDNNGDINANDDEFLDTTHSNFSIESEHQLVEYNMTFNDGSVATSTPVVQLPDSTSASSSSLPSFRDAFLLNNAVTMPGQMRRSNTEAPGSSSNEVNSTNCIWFSYSLSSTSNSNRQNDQPDRHVLTDQDIYNYISYINSIQRVLQSHNFSEWVTVFGFPPEALYDVLIYIISKRVEIVTYHPTPQDVEINWIYVKCYSEEDAERALACNGDIIPGRSIMIGVIKSVNCITLDELQLQESTAIANVDRPSTSGATDEWTIL